MTEIKVGTQIKLEVENIVVTITGVYDGYVRYEGSNGERGILKTNSIKKEQIVNEEHIINDVYTKGFVFIGNHTTGSKRVIYKSQLGFCVKHRGKLITVKKIDGIWESVE